MSPYKWSLNGQYWPDVTPFMIKTGQRVRVDMINNSAMAHPMHLLRCICMDIAYR